MYTGLFKIKLFVDRRCRFACVRAYVLKSELHLKIISKMFPMAQQIVDRYMQKN